MPTRRFLLLAAPALAAGLLGGCSTGTVAPDQTSPTMPPGTVAPTAVPESSVRIVLSTDAVRVVDAAEEPLLTLSYEQSTTQVVDLLVEVLDEEPVSTLIDGDAEGTAYEWPGLTVHDVGVADASPRFWLEVSSPEIAGIPVETADGYAVDDVIPVPEGADAVPGGDDVIALTDEGADGRVLELLADPGDGTVTALRVPAPQRG